MVHIASWEQQREQLPIVIEGWSDDGRTGEYAQWIINVFGRPGERALIRARQRYDRLKPARIRAARLHRAYRVRRPRWQR